MKIQFLFLFFTTIRAIGRFHKPVLESTDFPASTFSATFDLD